MSIKIEKSDLFDKWSVSFKDQGRVYISSNARTTKQEAINEFISDVNALICRLEEVKKQAGNM